MSRCVTVLPNKYTLRVQTAKFGRLKQTRHLRSCWQIGKNGRTLFDRPKPKVGCIANGRRHLKTTYVRGLTLQWLKLVHNRFICQCCFFKVSFPWLVQAMDIGIGIGSGHVIRQAGGETPFGRQRSLLIATLSRRLEGCCRRLIPWPHQQTGVWRKLRGEIKLLK